MERASGIDVTCKRSSVGWICEVTVRNPRETHHRVHVTRADLPRLAPGAPDPEELVRASFAFLLERESTSRSCGSSTSPSSGGTSPSTSARSGTAWQASRRSHTQARVPRPLPRRPWIASAARSLPSCDGPSRARALPPDPPGEARRRPDAINVANLAAQTAEDRPISVPLVRTAARTWYLRDKENSVSADSAATALLHFIQDDVIGTRRARAFLLEQEHAGDSLIAALSNARVLHVIKRGVAAKDQPGVRFDVFAIDYGAYVQLTATAKAPLGLFDAGSNGEADYVDVAADDYRSIRRAILNLDEFRRRLGT